MVTHSADETSAAGRRLGAALVAGDVLVLHGPLGAGKTTLVQGIAEALGAPGYGASPTFTLIREYPGRWPIFHVDLYRLGEDEAAELPLEECFDAGGVTIIEWPDRVASWLPPRTLHVEIAVVADETRVLSLLAGVRADAVAMGWARP